jgi:hypothetical protein
MRHALYQVASVLLGSLLVAGCGNAEAPKKLAKPSRTTEAQPPVPAVATTPLIRAIELAGNIRLDSTERLQIARSERTLAAEDKAQLEALLARYDRESPMWRAAARHVVRQQLHFNRAELKDPTPTALLDRRDPILVEDTKRKEVVTQADIRAIDASNRIMAKLAGISVPPLIEGPRDLAQLKTNYATSSVERILLTQADIRHAMVADGWPKLPANRKAIVMKAIRQHIRTPKDVHRGARELEAFFLEAERRRRNPPPARGLSAKDRAAIARLRQSIWRGHQATLIAVRGHGILQAMNTADYIAP